MTIEQNPPKKGMRWLAIGLIVVCAALLTAGLTVWLASLFLFPKSFAPVQLNAQEERILEKKIENLAVHSSDRQSSGSHANNSAAGPLKDQSDAAPEQYRERDADRTIHFTERELNGLLARNTQMATRLAIDLSDDLASAKLLVPLDPEFPLLGGKTLKVTAGLELRYAQKQPVVILRGVSIWGVPMPNAWLGGIKNMNLVNEFGADQGFWKTFAAGIDDIRIEDGRMALRLKP